MQGLDRRVTRLVPSTLEISIVKIIPLLIIPGRRPQMPSRPHGHVDHPRRPHVDRSWIEFVGDVLLRRDIWRRPAQSGRHARFIFPRHPKALAVAKIGDLQRPVRRQQQILRLEIPMRHPHLVHVLDPPASAA